MKDPETMQVLMLLMTRCNKRTEGCLTTSEVGRQMGLTPREMFRRLKRRGVIRYDKLMRCYMLHGDYRRRQLMLYRCCIYYSREGEPKMKQYPVWTPCGAEMIRQIAAEEDEE